MLRRVLVMGAPVSAGLCAAPIVKKVEKIEEKATSPSLICRASDLPIYTSLVDDRWVKIMLLNNIQLTNDVILVKNIASISHRN